MTITIINPKWENIIAEIIAYNLDLDFSTTVAKPITEKSDNFVYIYNQNFKMPNTPGLKVEIGFGQSKLLSNRSKIDENSSGGAVEIQEMTAVVDFVINVMSQDSSARIQKEFVIAALQSTYSQQKQEYHCFKFAKIPESFINLSTAEGGSMYNRFQATIKAFVWYKKEKTTDQYFDTFGAEVYDEPALEKEVPLFTIDNTSIIAST